MDHAELAASCAPQVFEQGEEARVLFHRGHLCAGLQKSPGKSAGARSDFQHWDIRENLS